MIGQTDGLVGVTVVQNAESDRFNAFLHAAKSEFATGPAQPFWDKIKTEAVTLVSSDEAPDSSTFAEEAANVRRALAIKTPPLLVLAIKTPFTRALLLVPIPVPHFCDRACPRLCASPSSGWRRRLVR